MSDINAPTKLNPYIQHAALAPLDNYKDQINRLDDIIVIHHKNLIHILTTNVRTIS